MSKFFGLKEFAKGDGYIGLKDFASGVQKLYKMYGNIPVFIQVDDRVAPVKTAISSSDLLHGNAILFLGGESKGEYEKEQFEEGDCTD